MHLFYDSTLNTWRLITENLPEKPRALDYPKVRWGFWLEDYKKYEATIAALKQNALTVGNTDLFWREDLNSDHIFIGNERFLIQDGKFYPWPGGVDILEKIPPVAILTLPEEKKNTMGNLTKEQALKILKRNASVPKPQITGVLEAMEEYANWIGSVSNEHSQEEEKLQNEWEHGYKKATEDAMETVAKKINELASLRQQLKDRDELIANLKQDIVRLVEDVNKAYDH